MVEDKELDLELEKRNLSKGDNFQGQKVEETAVANVSQPRDISTTGIKQEDGFSPISSEFAKRMDDVKVQVLENASNEDEKFVKTVKENLKDAAVKHTEVEQKKAEFVKQKVQFEQEKLETKQKENVHQQQEDKWANRQKRRQYHYDGVKPIMQFVGIETPMNLLLLYFLTLVLVWFFLISKLLKGTIGALIAGASDADRPKAVKGFLWTLLAIFTVIIIAMAVYLFLRWQEIIPQIKI